MWQYAIARLASIAIEIDLFWNEKIRLAEMDKSIF